MQRTNKRIDRDLTEEEINQEMTRIRNEMETKEKPKRKPDANIWNSPVTSFSKPNVNPSNNNTGWAKF